MRYNITITGYESDTMRLILNFQRTGVEAKTTEDLLDEMRWIMANEYSHPIGGELIVGFGHSPVRVIMSSFKNRDSALVVEAVPS